MPIFEKIKLKVAGKKVRQFRVFGIPVLETIRDKDGGSTKFVNLLFHERESYSSKANSGFPVFYLKVNRPYGYVFSCLQHWINIINELDADFYIVCDGTQLEKDILKYISFENTNIKFITSDRSTTGPIAEQITTAGWSKVACAHLRTFLHAKRNNIQSFWNIDADDTMFMTDPKTSAEILKSAQKYAEEHKLDVFSFDMWSSRTKNKHWSFGITYTRMEADWYALFNEDKNFYWTKKYEQYADIWNLDFYMTHLRDINHIKAESFYCENLSFIHWGDFLIHVISSGIWQFSNGRVIYPVLNDILGCPEIGNIPIADKAIRLDVDINTESCNKFALSFISDLRFYTKKTQKLWETEKVCETLDRSYE